MAPVQQGGKLEAPLLPRAADDGVATCSGGRVDGEGASFQGAVLNLSTTIIGAGIMSIPATVKVLGVVPALLVILVVAFLSDVSIEFLLRFTDAGTSTSYSGVMSESFGRLGRLILQMCVAITTMGTTTVYLIIIGDVLSGCMSEGSVNVGLLQEWFGTRWWNTREWALLFTCLLVLLPLVSFRRVDSLKFSSGLSVLLAVVFVLASAAMALMALFTGRTEKPRLFPKITDQSSVFKLFTTMPVLVSAFTCHFNVHHIKIELRKPSQMNAVARSSLLLCTIIYGATGFFGYLLFGEETMGDILSNFNAYSDSSPLSVLLKDVVRLSYAVHLMLVFPLLNFSLRINIDELLFVKVKKPLALDTRRFGIITVSLLASIYLIAISIPTIWIVFQFIGSTTAVSIAFIFPGAIVLRDVNNISRRRDMMLATTMIVVAATSSIIAITSNVMDFTKKS
ncbi:Sodium-coupled neutral amino acid transporter 3 [Nymphaea thermarum]|nr:Sodium-coupled neutral amino acid transporter 3 [Nymphaea thermarum]